MNPASCLHSLLPPPRSIAIGSDLLNSLQNSIVLLYNMVLTITSKPTFLPWPVFDYLSYYQLFYNYDNTIMYGRPIWSFCSCLSCFYFFHVFMSHWLLVWLCVLSDILLIYSAVGGSCAEHLTVESYTIIISLQSYLLSYLLLLVFHHPLTLSL